MSNLFGSTATPAATTTSTTSQFVFPGSARNHDGSEFFSSSSYHNHQGDNVRRNSGEFFDSPAAKKSAVSTPIENPLLFRTSMPSGVDRNNNYDDNNFPSSTTTLTTTTTTNQLQPFGNVSMNQKSSIGRGSDGGSGSGGLRQRKGYTFDGSKESTTTSIDPVVTTISNGHRVLPPRASYSLGTHNKTNHQRSGQPKLTTTLSSSSPYSVTTTPSFGNGGQIDSRGLASAPSPNVFSFSSTKNETGGRLNKPELHITTTSTTPAIAAADGTSPHNMYSPSQLSLITTTNGTASWDDNNNSNSIGSTTSRNVGGTYNGPVPASWVFVFGATISTVSLYDDAIQRLSEFGHIISHRGRSNWIAVQYQSEIEAEKAACHRRMKFYTGTDTVYFTIQRLLPTDPEMSMVLQTQQGSTSLYSGYRQDGINNTVNSRNIWTGSTSTSITDENTSVASGRIDSSGGLLLTAGSGTGTTDDASVDTVVISNKQASMTSLGLATDALLVSASAIGLNDEDDDGLLLNVAPRRLQSTKDEFNPRAISVRPRDSFCIKLLKWVLSIEEDE